jgi:O-acetyl-ADP-ribose deacetylase (regulator of RNase III)
MIEIHADLLDSELPAIGHGVNLRGVMGAGIAGQIRKRYPQLYIDYRADLVSGGYTVFEAKNQLIYNLASQVEPGANASLDLIDRSVASALWDVRCRELNVLGLPEIGCGIGGLVWDDVRFNLLQLEKWAGVQIVVCRWP